MVNIEKQKIRSARAWASGRLGACLCCFWLAAGTLSEPLLHLCGLVWGVTARGMHCHVHVLVGQARLNEASGH